MKTKFRVLSVFVSVLMVATLFAFPATGVKAENGPATDQYAYILYVDTEENYNFVYAADLYKTQNSVTETTVKGLSYDIKTNTLTLNKFSGYYLETNMMGDDFKIKVTGENDLTAMRIWGDHYGGSVTFTGKGTLCIAEILRMDAESSNANITVKKGVTIIINGVYDDTNCYILTTGAKSGLVLEKGVKTNKNAIRVPLFDYSYDDDGNIVYLLEKNGETYGTYITQDNDGTLNFEVITGNGKTETYKGTKKRKRPMTGWLF